MLMFEVWFEKKKPHKEIIDIKFVIKNNNYGKNFYQLFNSILNILNTIYFEIIRSTFWKCQQFTDFDFMIKN